MKNIVLIACSSKKKKEKSLVIDIYISTLFKYSYEYAKKLNPDKIFVLSAKYGLLEMNQVIEPYNETLNTKTKIEKMLWSEKIETQLIEKGIDLKNDNIIFLSGKNYRENLIKHINNYLIPLKGLSIGNQLKYLKSNIVI